VTSSRETEARRDASPECGVLERIAQKKQRLHILAGAVCNNNCIFCFLKQQPQNWRRTLYLRDDDYRLSFLFGNFITLTNLHRGDWLRLDEQRLSPLFISVHATDPELRRFLLGKKKLPDIRQQLARLEWWSVRGSTMAYTWNRRLPIWSGGPRPFIPLPWCPLV